MNPYQQPITKSKLFVPELYHQSEMYFFPYARYAFLEILKQHNIKSIYLPSFICRDMLSPINVLKIKYFFYDVNQNLEPLLEDIECDALVMVNYFGFEQPIEPFLKYTQKYNALLIEDNAHGFLSKDKQGAFLGTRGDLGLLSIRKTLSLPNGAALLINRESFKDIPYSAASILETSEDTYYFSKQRLKGKIFHKAIGIGIVLARRIIRFIKTGSALPLPDAMSEQELPSNSYLTPLLKDKTLSLDVDVEIKRRIEMYRLVQKWAEYFDIKPIYSLYEGVSPYEFAFIDNGKANQFEKFLFLKGFFILPWPDLPDEIVSTCPKFYKNIKVVPFLW